ncbi:MAG: radical SAM protein [Ilumatobacter sp.]|uniref:radical SAM/SPASM domain-containing protein n=1 Tax=Ilumatobacter sp. TaxID=1967498 RepID=UPI00263963EE|nr:radical SAM protein [Ilumatobacter sp.]MDJ0768317.1 radical SAM protein [Ilumatobacter sp.]
MLYPSSYNHLIEVTTGAGDDARIVSNLFTGGADFVNREVFEFFSRAERDGGIDDDRLDPEVLRHFTERGFLWSEADAEEDMVRGLGTTYGGRDEIAAGLKGGQYGLITSLNCNLACPYCFQQEHADSVGFLTPTQVDLAIAAITRCETRVAELAEGPTIPKISITGGEPLLPNRANAEVLDYIVERLIELDWPFNITTNGTELARFVDRHELTDRCRNIQVTLDGPREVHDLRRAFRGGQPSFDRIVDGVDRALALGWSITMRVNLDMYVVGRLVELADFVVERGWLDRDNFFAYVSPVTDHGSLGGDESAPADEADLLAALLDEVQATPRIRDVFDIRHFRGFNYVERILVDHEPRFPVIYRCEAISGMYIFDPAGDVYVCLESVGEPHRRVGRYDPEFVIDEEAASRWASRSVLRMPYCDGCKVRFICAGGCAIEGFNKGDGNACMPFLDEIDIAWRFFADTRPELFA